MRILILGGTVFLGRHLVDAARARGHELTLFNRGQSNPDLFADLEQLRGDRTQDLSALADRRWDCVIDTSGYLPGVVAASVNALRDKVEHYTFVSSISVYADPSAKGITETSPVAQLEPGQPEKLEPETYGALKAACERTVESMMPDRSASVRAGLIYGPHDTTDRSGYWPLRFADGGEVLAPGTPDRPIQLIDVRDLAEWLVRLAEARGLGVFNATGPNAPLTMGGFLEACREAAGVSSTVTWIPEDFLLERNVIPFNELPLWVPASMHSFGDVSCARAAAAGLRNRPLLESVRATLEWARTLPPGPRKRRAGVPIGPGMTRERETELLAEWRAGHATRAGT